MASKQALLKLSQTWPKDLARPNLQFSELLKYVAEDAASKVSPRTVAAVQWLQSDRMMNKVSS